jgi:parallel beta-helix repeat protein
MRLMFHPLGLARTLLASLVLAGIVAGAASAASIPISSAGTIIDRPGAYHLTQNIDGEGQLFALVIASRNVILDLKGKTISGIGVVGILVTPEAADVLITGGAITGFAAGIHLAAPERVNIRDMKILRNLVGIVGGRSHISVVYNLIADNGLDGVFLTGDYNHVCNNRVVRNGNEELVDEFLGGDAPEEDDPIGGSEEITAGVRIEGDHAQIVCNTAGDNRGFGISVEGNDHLVYNNTACFNQRSGLRLYGSSSRLARNRSSENMESGILLVKGSDNNRIESNVALKNKQYDIFDGNLPDACTNGYRFDLFQTSNDLSGACIQ